MTEIFRVQAQGLDDTLLRNPELGAAKARERRLGLEAGLDISLIADVSLPLTNIQSVSYTHLMADLGLKDTLEVTYSGTGFETVTDNASVNWSPSVPANFGAKQTDRQVFTGTVAIPEWATVNSTAVSREITFGTPVKVEGLVPVSYTHLVTGGTINAETQSTDTSIPDIGTIANNTFNVKVDGGSLNAVNQRMDVTAKNSQNQNVYPCLLYTSGPLRATCSQIPTRSSLAALRPML